MITITIDPGHGGSELGTKCGSVYEKDFTLILAKDLALSFHGTKIGTELTRYEDVEVDKPARAFTALKSQSRLAISLHVNAIASPAIRGIEFYVLPSAHAAGNAFGFALAQSTTQLYNGKFRSRYLDAEDNPKTPDDDWLRNARAVLRHYNCPAILVECGYATNTLDLAVLQDDWKRAQLVSALRQSIFAALEFLTAGDA